MMNTIVFDKIKDRNNALDIKADGITPLRWERYDKKWHIADEKYLPLYQAFVNKSSDTVKLSDIERQNKKVKDFIEKIFVEETAWADFIQCLFRFRNMSLNNIVLTAAFCPSATVVKSYVEWSKYAFKIVRTGIYYYDFKVIESRSKDSRGEDIVKRICSALEKRKYQKTGRFLVRKNEENAGCYDIFRVSYETKVETLKILKEAQSKKELKYFIIENVLDKEIETEKIKLDLILYPDTAVTAENVENDPVGEAYLEGLKNNRSIAIKELYNTLYCLCMDNGIERSVNEQTVEKAAKSLLRNLAEKYVPEQYIDLVSDLVFLFYGIAERIPDIRCWGGIDNYEQKRECLHDIKRSFDLIVYNIEIHINDEIVYTFKARETVEDFQRNEYVRGEHDEMEESFEMSQEVYGNLQEYNEDDFADYDEAVDDLVKDAEDIYAMAFGEDNADLPAAYEEKLLDIHDAKPEENRENRINTQRIYRIFELPETLNDLEGIYIHPTYEELSVKIGLYEERLFILKNNIITPFTILMYNDLVDKGYEKAIIRTDGNDKSVNLLAVMEEDGEWECDYLIAYEEYETILCENIPEDERKNFVDALKDYDGGSYINTVTNNGRKLYVFPIDSIENMIKFMQGDYREYDDMACYFSATRTSRRAFESAIEKNIYIGEYDDESDKINQIPIHEEWKVEIKKEGEKQNLYIDDVFEKELRDYDALKIKKINDHLLRIGLPVIKGSNSKDMIPVLVAGTISGGKVSFYKNLRDAVNAYQLMPASNHKNIILQVDDNEKTRKNILKKGKIDKGTVKTFEKWIDTKIIEEYIEEITKSFDICDDYIADDDFTPAKKKWIAENKVEELHNVTVSLWQLKPDYKARFRGIPYKILHEVLKENVRSSRYTKKIELTLRSCENLSTLRDSFYYQVFVENPEEPFLEEYFIGDRPDRIYIGDLIEIYSAQDKLYSLAYIDTKGFVEIKRAEYYEEDITELSSELLRFKQQYEKDRILAIVLNLKVEEKIAKIINAIPGSILKFPSTQEEFIRYKRRALALAARIIEIMQYAPVLICNRCISMLQDNEKYMKEKKPDIYQEVMKNNRLLKKGEIIPFKMFVETVNAYQKAVVNSRSAGCYEGYDTIDYMIFGSVPGAEDVIYMYFSSFQTRGEYQSVYGAIKRDMNFQYQRLYEEYTGRRKRNAENINNVGKIKVRDEMDSYIQVVKAINAALSIKSDGIFDGA